MRAIALALCVLAAAAVRAQVPGPMRFELLPYKPVANASAVVITADGKVRFTVLTPSLIRCEWSPSGVFEDRPSLAVVNRNLPVPSFSVRGWRRIEARAGRGGCECGAPGAVCRSR